MSDDLRAAAVAALAEVTVLVDLGPEYRVLDPDLIEAEKLLDALLASPERARALIAALGTPPDGLQPDGHMIVHVAACQRCFEEYEVEYVDGDGFTQARKAWRTRSEP